MYHTAEHVDSNTAVVSGAYHFQFQSINKPVNIFNRGTVLYGVRVGNEKMHIIGSVHVYMDITKALV